MRILVTGAQGLIGTAASRRLAERGGTVVLLDLRPGDAPPDSVSVRGDILPPADLLDAMHAWPSMDAVVRTAGRHGSGSDSEGSDG